MTLTDHQRQLIAELKTLPGFNLLMQLFTDFEAGLAADIAASTTSATMLKAARTYQVVRYVREFLQSRPELADRELRALLEQQQALDNFPKSMEEVWLKRFGPGDEEPIQ